MLNQRNISTSHQLTATDFITNSVYTGRPIINETKTTTVTSYIRTGDSYFCQKEHHINTMVQGFGLPQIFYTITMAENHWPLELRILTRNSGTRPDPTRSELYWPHLHNILSKTDNKD